MNIGDVAAITGLTAKMIRYYETNGLMRKPERTTRGYRAFTRSDVDRLQFIHCALELGLRPTQIRQLLLLWDDRKRNGAKLKNVARGYLAQFEKKAAHLTDMIATLDQYVDAKAARSDTPVLVKRHSATTPRS